MRSEKWEVRVSEKWEVYGMCVCVCVWDRDRIADRNVCRTNTHDQSINQSINESSIKHQSQDHKQSSNNQSSTITHTHPISNFHNPFSHVYYSIIFHQLIWFTLYGTDGSIWISTPTSYEHNLKKSIVSKLNEPIYEIKARHHIK